MSRLLVALCVVILLVMFSWTYFYAITPTFDFLQDYIGLSKNWHRNSLYLRIISFGITVLSAGIALLQASKHKSVARFTVVLSLLVAALNGLVSFAFLTDFRSYEKAYGMYEREINQFKTAYEDIDVGDSSIAEEYRNARIDLVKKLEDIRLDLIGGKLGASDMASLELMPIAVAQEKGILQVPRNTENYYYFIGMGIDTFSLVRAKAAALRNALSKVAVAIGSDVDGILTDLNIVQAEREGLRNLFIDSTSVASLSRVGNTVGTHFNKRGRDYEYSLLLSLPKQAIPYMYSEIRVTGGDERARLVAKVVDALKQKYSSAKTR